MKKMCDMEKQLNSKLNNIDEYRKECSSRISDYKFSDKRIKLLISTSIIIETAMLNAYEISRICDTRAITNLYGKGILNPDYQNMTTNIKLVRNYLVHINVGIDGPTESLKIDLEDVTTRQFKDYTKDLFGKYNIFTDNEISDLLEMLTEPLGIDVFKNDTDEMFGN